MTEGNPSTSGSVPGQGDPLANLGSVCPDFGLSPPNPSIVRNLVVPIWDQIVKPAPLSPRRADRTLRPTSPE